MLFGIAWKEAKIHFLFVNTLLSQAVTLKIASLLARISSSPFVLTWEETYRIYYASLLASERIYGFKVPLSPIDFSLNLLNGIPFLLGDFPIWIHRLWYVFLTIGITFLTAWGLIHRIKVTHRWYRWQLIAFAWLYLLMEGGVKYNLQVAVLLIYSDGIPEAPLAQSGRYFACFPVGRMESRQLDTCSSNASSEFISSGAIVISKELVSQKVSRHPFSMGF